METPLISLPWRIYHDLPSVRDLWLDLERRAPHYPFQRYDWLELWQRTIGAAHGWTPAILVLGAAPSDDAAISAAAAPSAASPSASAADPVGSPPMARALVPLGLVRRGGIRQLCWLGEPVSDYAAPLVDPAGACSAAELMDAVRTAARQLACDLIALDRNPAFIKNASNPMMDQSVVDATSHNAHALKRAPASSPVFRPLHYHAHSMTLPAADAPLFPAHFSAKERYKLRRSERLLAAAPIVVPPAQGVSPEAPSAGAAIQPSAGAATQPSAGAATTLLFFAPSANTQKASLTNDMIRLKRLRYGATGAVDPLADPPVADFYRQAALAIPGVDISALVRTTAQAAPPKAATAPSAGAATTPSAAAPIAVPAAHDVVPGEILALHWGIADDDTMYYLMPVFAPGDSAKYSPGMVLLVRFLEHCRSRGLARLDFTIGDEDYKLHWRDSSMNLYAYTEGLTLKGRAFELLRRALDLLRASTLRKPLSRMRAQCRKAVTRR